MRTLFSLAIASVGVSLFILSRDSYAAYVGGIFTAIGATTMIFAVVE